MRQDIEQQEPQLHGDSAAVVYSEAELDNSSADKKKSFTTIQHQEQSCPETCSQTCPQDSLHDKNSSSTFQEQTNQQFEPEVDPDLEPELDSFQASNRMDYDSALNSIISARNNQNHQNNNNNNNSKFNSSDDSEKTCNESPAVSFYERFIVGDVVKNFSPAYFVSVMGTGISSSLLYHFPFPAQWLIDISYIMFAICCLLFIFNVALFTMACIYFPGRWRLYHVDPQHASFMGAFSMGYITIVNYISILTKGHHMYLVWTLWWIAVFTAMYTSFIIVYFAFFSKLNKVELDAKLNATLLLPIVAITVVSSLGHQIELDLYKQNETIITMVVSFMLWCLSISLAFMIMTLYVGRLIMHKIPPTNLIFTSFLPVGFLGQSSYSIYLFGMHLDKYIPQELLFGKILLCIGGFFATFLLSFGYFMTFVALVSIFSKIWPFARTPNPNHTNKLGLLKHNKGFWAMTFPMGTMSLGNLNLGKGAVGNHPLRAFTYMSAIFAVACILVTTACLIGCVVYSVGKIREEVKYFWSKKRRNNECCKEDGCMV
ncbi:conserved hypothetical protein [Lodderomyces elongisporus NRRL YB-4239]|uniref:Sulfite efflux pump SSU1 n=1 Tax=Lodderomyces elongisporus (strain ATCC 11503 / CBS 2605 / JCM 1781 / NBRC 1676 / NRRL YB-4239) TaxID=379508 RepID=A5E6X1_LODEL|nr:conserved hypothetical protein [Lodderomyces elongisporus NRRL YB-4239]